MTCYTYKASVSGTQDIIEYETLTSGQSVPFERRERLHEWLKAEDIEQLHQAFLDHPEQMLNFNELRAALLKLDISFTDSEFNRLFLKINQNRDFKCDWDEFISYLIFGFQEDDPSTQKEALILPISTPPVVKKSEHRSAVVGITLMRGNDASKTANEDQNEENILETPSTVGMWVTASKEGQIKFWTPQLEPIRGGYSESIYLKMTTWILAVQAMSDVGIICTSSTERELRFHETIASTFSLRLVIRSVPFAVCCMSYHCHPKYNSRLIFGDFGGNVRILEFSPHQRGPFQSKPGAALIELVWSDILKGKLPLFMPHEYINIHSELICKVYYSFRTSNLFTASEYRNTKKYRGRCPGLIIAGTTESTIFRIPLGVTTFFFDDKQNIVVTGGPDTFVRIWDIFIPFKPSGILTGHNGGIVMVFLQFEDKKVFSVDYQKILKVWHLDEHTLLQTFGDLVFLMPNEVDLIYNYNPKGRDLLVCGRKLIIIKCNPKVRTDLTDGNTHAGPVSVLLYNSLFRNLVTCGLDSYIIVWDPWSGKRKIIMKSCHTKQIYGETIDIEITAACFDPLEQFLLTGARDGSLKIWNYNNAVCMRNMSIKSEHEVTAVIWVVERILAVGWDQQVTEFNDAQGREYGDPKKWPKFHGDDITCADVKMGEGVVTGTYSGELIFWKLETGQPYRRYNVADPKKFIELKYNVDEVDRFKKSHDEVHQVNVSRFVRRSVSDNIRTMEEQIRRSSSIKPKAISPQNDEKEAILLDSVRRQQTYLPLSVQAVLFLQKRPMTKEHGSVFVALDSGMIQVYSHHQRGGYISQFNSIHKTGDCVLTMTTDRKNRFLFTGTAFGYIKIWLIENYCIPESEKVHVCMPLLRLQFIFLRKERFLTRAKRLVRNLKEPLLVNSYKAHLQAINSIVFINLPKVLLSGSHDCSCRLWSIGGRYLGTLGTILPWKNLSPFDQPDDTIVYRLPPEIKKVASSTTMKVISGVQVDRVKVKPMTKPDDANNNADEEEATNIYGKPLREPILGKHFVLPGKSAQEQRIELNQSYSYIPVYTQLKVHETPQIERPPTPPIIHKTIKQEYMDFYMPVETKITDINTTSSGHQLATDADNDPLSDK